MNSENQSKRPVAIGTGNSEKEVKSRDWCTLEGLPHPLALPGKTDPNTRPPAPDARAQNRPDEHVLECLPEGNRVFMG